MFLGRRLESAAFLNFIRPRKSRAERANASMFSHAIRSKSRNKQHARSCWANGWGTKDTRGQRKQVWRSRIRTFDRQTLYLLGGPVRDFGFAWILSALGSILDACLIIHALWLFFPFRLNKNPRRSKRCLDKRLVLWDAAMVHKHRPRRRQTESGTAGCRKHPRCKHNM